MERDSELKGKVVEVINEKVLVINKGTLDGVKEGYKFLVYTLGKEIFDPDTNESLGILEVVKGYGKVVHVQEKMATIESVKVARNIGTKTVVKNNTPLASIIGTQETITYEEDERIIPFIKPKIGDLVKYIS